MLSLERLHLRAAFLRAIRTFFHSQGFLEVDTPIRQPVYIPESNIEPLASNGQFLQSSPELCMKRLLVLGCERIFQISHCFRKGELGRLHLEEFQMLEWYRTGSDYLQLMTDCQELVRHVVATLWEGQTADLLADVDLSGQWPRLKVAEAFERYCPYSLDWALANDQFEIGLVEYVEPHLGHRTPVFLCDYPVQLASLARTSLSNPQVVERFELYINGIELANGFTELTDAVEQRLRFEMELAAIRAKRGTTMAMPERFLQDLEKLKEAAGIALGVDRLFMLLLGGSSISSAVTFGPEDFL
jgi:lysyl-tRNA synthetase class 2